MSNLYTIPAAYGFANELARHLLASFDPLTLSQTVIYLPTRRAVRTVQAAFAHQAAGASHILPRLQTLGDLDADELGLGAAHMMDGTADRGIDTALTLPPAMGQAQRLFYLSRLVDQAWDGLLAMSQPKSTIQTFAHARALLTLLDTIETEGLSLDDVAKAAPQGERFLGFWDQAAKFITLVQKAMPLIEAEAGRISAAARRRRLLEIQAHQWQATPPSHPVILAGTTATIPAVADLARVMADLPQGQIVLPGLDPHLDAQTWAAVAQRPSHPQHGMVSLLTKLGAVPSDVLPWPGTQFDHGLDRHWAFSAAQRPPGAKPVSSTAPIDLGGLMLAESLGSEDEARAIALFLREALETPEATAALITPDRDLAGRVAAELRRWDLIVDDSAGVALTATLAGRLAVQTAALLSTHIDPLALLTALGHPLCQVDPPLVHELDLQLRGSARQLGVDDLAAFDLDWPAPLIHSLQAGLAGAHPLADWVDRHLTLIDALCPNLETWTGPVGEALAHVFEDLAAQSPLLPPLNLGDYAALLTQLLAGESVRAAYGTHPRLAILGTLEARMISVDAVALGGLNEGVWPKETDVGPWMNRPTRAAIGLPSPERKIGLAAHDLAQALGAKRVMLSRATRVDGIPTLPSRWLERFKALAEQWGKIDALRAAGRPYLDWAAQLDHPTDINPMGSRPAPPQALATPPLHVRPKKIWATDVGLLVTNPYGFYAKRILNLRPLDPRGSVPANLQWGNFIHDLLDKWMQQGVRSQDSLHTLAAQQLQALDISAGDRALYQAHLDHTLARFWEFNLPYLHDASDTEIAGSFTIAGVTVAGKADRLVRSQGLIHVIDYKTGAGASAAQQTRGEKPQLAILGLMAQAGGFGGAKPQQVSTAFFELPRRVLDAGRATQESDKILGEVAEGLKTLFTAYQDPAQPYLSAPFGDPGPYDAYGHLARVRGA